MTDAPLEAIDAYADTFPRSLADAEELGPFRIFVGRDGWNFYARPIPGAASFTVGDVESVMARQVELGRACSFEWLHEATPGLVEVVRTVGLTIFERPLMIWSGKSAVRTDVVVEMVDADDPTFAESRSAVWAGFGQTDALEPEPWAARIADAVRAGHMSVAGAFLRDGTLIGGGSRTRSVDGSEITGIAVRPAYRGLGAGAALAALLATDARDTGATLIYLSATDESVARVYARAGFIRVGTAFEAEPA